MVLASSEKPFSRFSHSNVPSSLLPAQGKRDHTQQHHTKNLRHHNKAHNLTAVNNTVEYLNG